MAIYEPDNYDVRNVPAAGQDGVAMKSMEDIRQSISRIEAILDRGHELLYGEQQQQQQQLPLSDPARRRSSAEAGSSSSVPTSNALRPPLDAAALQANAMPPTVQRLSLDSSRRRAAANNNNNNNGGGGGGASLHSMSQRSSSSGQAGRRRGPQHNGYAGAAAMTTTARTATTTNSRSGSVRAATGFNLPLPQHRAGSVRSSAAGSLFQNQTAQEEPSARHSYMRTSRTSVSQMTFPAPTTRRTARTQPSVSARGRRLARASLMGHRLPNFEEGIDADDLPQDLTLQELKDRVHRELEAYRRHGPLDPLRHRLPAEYASTGKAEGSARRGRRRRVPLWQPRTVNPRVSTTHTANNNNNNGAAASRGRNVPMSRARATSARPASSAVTGAVGRPLRRPWSGRAQSYQSPYKQQPMPQSRRRPQWQPAQSYSSQQQQVPPRSQSSQKEKPTRHVGAWLSTLVTAVGIHGYDRRATTNSNLSGRHAATSYNNSSSTNKRRAPASTAPRWNSGSSLYRPREAASSAAQAQRSPPARDPHSVVHPQRFLVSRPKPRSAPDNTTTTTPAASHSHAAQNNSSTVSAARRAQAQQGVPVWERLYKMAAAQREASVVAAVAARRAEEEARHRALSLQSSRRQSRSSLAASSRRRHSTATTITNTAAAQQQQQTTTATATAVIHAAQPSSASQSKCAEQTTNNEATTTVATTTAETMDGRYESCVSAVDHNHSTSVEVSAPSQQQDEPAVPHFVTPLQLDALKKK